MATLTAFRSTSSWKPMAYTSSMPSPSVSSLTIPFPASLLPCAASAVGAPSAAESDLFFFVRVPSPPPSSAFPGQTHSWSHNFRRKNATRCDRVAQAVGDQYEKGHKFSMSSPLFANNVIQVCLRFVRRLGTC